MKKQQQVQIQNDDLELKLNKIITLLNKLIARVDGDTYPDESRLKRSYIKKEAKLDKKIKTGKMGVQKFKSFAELDKSLN